MPRQYSYNERLAIVLSFLAGGIVCEYITRPRELLPIFFVSATGAHGSRGRQDYTVGWIMTTRSDIIERQLMKPDEI